ncbi:MAG: hypothetical protein M1819_000844 [Sarea resinae]|nr:MAG: hypothetical protein M1819_000844 [Sarea resinae]
MSQKVISPTWAFFAQGTFRHINIQSQPQLRRTISLNSAIHRGIRRSRPAARRDDNLSDGHFTGQRDDITEDRRPPRWNGNRDEGTRRDRYPERKPNAYHDERPRRPRNDDINRYPSAGRRQEKYQDQSNRRDGYQQRQDAEEDTKPGSNGRDARSHPGQRKDSRYGYSDGSHLDSPRPARWLSKQETVARSAPRDSNIGSDSRSSNDARYAQKKSSSAIDNDRARFAQEDKFQGKDQSSKGGFTLRDGPKQPRPSRVVPLSIPYTTSASEFLYGTSPVTAALKARRRKLYKLYIYTSPEVEEDEEALSRDRKVKKEALLAGVAPKTVTGGDWVALMQKMSDNRPHNRLILEASPLPKLPVDSLQQASPSQNNFEVQLRQQSREEAIVNGTENKIQYQARKGRYPFVLMLDEILDPGNLGAILRSAFYFGVDAIAIGNRTCAPLSPVALKAAAGAAEFMPLLSVPSPRAFVQGSMKNGWNFYAAMPPPDNSLPGAGAAQRFVTTDNLDSPLWKHPCVLMLGGEGKGLRETLRGKAVHDVSISGLRANQSGVDSLNVSVAAALLCEAFMREPHPSTAPKDLQQQRANKMF